MAIWSSSSSAYPSTKGIACSGLHDERRRKRRFGSPRVSPSVVATCTRWVASTTPPRRTVTLIASTDAGAYVAGTARGRSVAPSARPAREAVADRAGGPRSHRDAEDIRPAAEGARRRGPARSRAAREALPAPDRRQRARLAGAPDERGQAQVRAEGWQGREDAGVPLEVRRRR